MKIQSHAFRVVIGLAIASFMALGCGEDRVAQPAKIDLTGAYRGTFSGGTVSNGSINTRGQETFALFIEMHIEDSSFFWAEEVGLRQPEFVSQHGIGIISIDGDSLHVVDTEMRDALNLYYIIGGSYWFEITDDVLVMMQTYPSGYRSEVVLQKVH